MQDYLNVRDHVRANVTGVVKWGQWCAIEKAATCEVLWCKYVSLRGGYDHGNCSNWLLRSEEDSGGPVWIQKKRGNCASRVRLLRIPICRWCGQPRHFLATEVSKDFPAQEDHFKTPGWEHFSAVMGKYPPRIIDVNISDASETRHTLDDWPRSLFSLSKTKLAESKLAGEQL